MTTPNTGDPMVASLVQRRDNAVGQIESLKQLAIDGERDLTESELEAVETYKRSIADIDKQLAVIGDDVAMSDEARARLAGVSGITAPTKYRSAGELLFDMIHQSDPDAQRRYRSHTRAAEHMGTLKADTTAVAGDLEGIAVQPIVGPVVQPAWRSMPFMSAIGTRSIPAYTFERPYVTDPGLDTGVDTQATQKAELASVAFEIDSDILKGTTVGGYLNVSQQLISMQPGSLGVIYDQMRLRMSRKLENLSIAELANSTGQTPLALDADAATTLKAIYDASAAVFDATGDLATHIVMGPAGWARLGSMVDLAGRPLLPSLGPINAVGTARADTFQATGPAGLSTVVTPAIGGGDSTFWVVNSSCIELYTYAFPLLEAVEPSVLGRQVAVATSLVAHRPTPTANAAQHLEPAV